MGFDGIVVWVWCYGCCCGWCLVGCGLVVVGGLLVVLAVWLVFVDWFCGLGDCLLRILVGIGCLWRLVCVS